MDTKSTIGFIVSCLALFAAYTFLFAPSEEEIEAQRIEQARLDSLAKIEQPANIENNTLGEDTAQLAADSKGEFVQVESDSNRVTPVKTSEDVVITTKRWEMTVNTKGGLPDRLVLRDGYVAYQDSSPVELWDHTSDKSSMNITFQHDGRIINTEDLYFTPSTSSLTVEEDTEITFSSDLGGGAKVELKYLVYPDKYDTDVTLNLVNAGKSGSEVILDWNTAALHQEKGIYNEQLHSSVFFKTFEDGRDYLGESREDEETVEDKLNWVAHKQNYFSVLAISENGFGNGGFLKSYPADTEKDTLHSCYYETKVALTQNHSGNGAIPFKLYMGPNDLTHLEALNTDGVVKIPDYGWTIFGWVNRNAIAPFFNWMSNNLPLGAGMLIFLLTLVVKTLLFPVQWKNYFNSAKMKVLKPEIDEINKKFEGKNAMEKQQATMALYKQTGVNPMAGCLPALLQMPILYAMFRFFPANIDLRQKSFLWADDLGSYDAIVNLPFEIPFYGAHVSGFTVLMAISMFFYTRMSSGNMPQSTQPGMPNMKIIMNVFPVMMLFFFNKFAAGLSLYYFLANIFSISQMLIIKKFLINEDKIRDKIEANKKKPAKKKSAFAQRLEDMQKEQQKKVAQQKKKK
ncbi:MAG: membrane protein insertase YidC [Flavobacteriales bacterium]